MPRHRCPVLTHRSVSWSSDKKRCHPHKYHRLGAWHRKEDINNKRHIGPGGRTLDLVATFCLSCQGTCHALPRPRRYDSHGSMLQAAPLSSVLACWFGPCPPQETQSKGLSCLIIPRSSRFACCRWPKIIATLPLAFCSHSLSHTTPTAQPQTYRDAERAMMA